MPYQLNASHPLFANVVECIGVQGGALVSLKTARTFTVDAGASFVAGGAYGEAFRSLANGYNRKGASFSPLLSIDTAKQPDLTLLLVVNAIGAANGSWTPLVGHTDPKTVGIGSFGGKALALHSPRAAPAITGTLTVAGNGAHSLALARTGQTACALFVDGIPDGSAGALTLNGYPVKANEIGGVQGSGSITADIVWAFWFNKVLSQSELAAIHASLGPDNAISLVTNSGGASLIFSGAIANQSAVAGTPFSLATAPFFSGGVPPYVFSLGAGALPAGLAIDNSSGVISGTPSTAGVASGLVVQAVDSAGAPQTASSNAFSITVAATTNAPPQFVGPNLGDLSATVGAALPTVNVAGSFSDGDALTFSAVGSWPAGVALSAAGAISGTPTAAGSYTNLRVRATDTAAQSVESNAFAINVAAIAGATITTAPLKNNAGSLLANVGGITVFVHVVASGALVTSKTGLATNAAGVLSFSDPAMASGATYRIVIRVTGTGAEGMVTLVAGSGSGAAA